MPYLFKPSNKYLTKVQNMPEKCRVKKATPPPRIAADFIIDDKQIAPTTKTNYYERCLKIAEKYYSDEELTYTTIRNDTINNLIKTSEEELSQGKILRILIKSEGSPEDIVAVAVLNSILFPASILESFGKDLKSVIEDLCIGQTFIVEVEQQKTLNNK